MKAGDEDWFDVATACIIGAPLVGLLILAILANLEVFS